MSDAQLREIVLATTNKGKLSELCRMLADSAVTVRGLDEFGPPAEAREDADSFRANARLKAVHYGGLLDRWVLADDSGLQVDALAGSPGVLSARFAGVDGPDRDRANNEKLLQRLAQTPAEKRTARFCCCLCLSHATQVVLEVEGFLEGLIAQQAAGNNGFGYDPIFYLPEQDKTIAQLSSSAKNEVSHRAKAFQQLMRQLCRWSMIVSDDVNM